MKKLIMISSETTGTCWLTCNGDAHSLSADEIQKSMVLGWNRTSNLKNDLISLSKVDDFSKKELGYVTCQDHIKNIVSTINLRVLGSPRYNVNTKEKT